MDRPLLDEFARALGKVIDDANHDVRYQLTDTVSPGGWRRRFDELMDEFLQASTAFVASFSMTGRQSRGPGCSRAHVSVDTGTADQHWLACGGR